jgi:DNA-binding GntR family transcriptional regulator
MAADQAAARSPSLYRKVAGDIKAAIAAGEYAAGTRLPSENELAERYSVSRGTVRQAFAASLPNHSPRDGDQAAESWLDKLR